MIRHTRLDSHMIVSRVFSSSYNKIIGVYLDVILIVSTDESIGNSHLGMCAHDDRGTDRRRCQHETKPRGLI